MTCHSSVKKDSKSYTLFWNSCNIIRFGFVIKRLDISLIILQIEHDTGGYFNTEISSLQIGKKVNLCPYNITVKNASVKIN